MNRNTKTNIVVLVHSVLCLAVGMIFWAGVYLSDNSAEQLLLFLFFFLLEFLIVDSAHRRLS